MRKTFLSIFCVLILIINLISFVSADKMSGSFTITGEAVEEVNVEDGVTEGAKSLAEDSFLNSIKNFFIYAFTLGGKFEIKDPEPTHGEPSTIRESTGDMTTEPTGSGDKSEDPEDYNQTNKTTDEEKSKEIETPLRLKQSETIFIIVMVLIVIVLFLLKRKISKLFKGKERKKKK